MLKLSKKYKKIAHGDMHIYKKYFTSDIPTIEKYINLSLYQTQLETMGYNTDIIKAELNKGKIFVKLTILDFMEVKKKFLPKDTSNKDALRSNKLKQGKANAHVDEIEMNDETTTQNEFEDGLSELSISIVDVNEDGREGMELTEFINEDYLSKLKANLQLWNDALQKEFQRFLSKRS